MLFGEYGFGKTTSAEYVAALMDALPREVVWASEIRGHPEQTEEKMVARPDLGKLNAGVEKVLWSYFVLNPTKIVDEFNRLPASKQNILLDGIESGNWKYLSDLVQTGDFTLFATCNYEYLGNSALIEPVLDRFDIATESKKPGLVQLSMIKDISDDVKKVLDDREISDKVFEIYDQKDIGYDEKQEKVKGIRESYRKKIEEKTRNEESTGNTQITENTRITGKAKHKICPDCGSETQLQEGCVSCKGCGWALCK